MSRAVLIPKTSNRATWERDWMAGGGEKWLDLNSENVRRIMSKRIELAAEKGFDAIDPDNIDGYVSSPWT